MDVSPQQKGVLPTSRERFLKVYANLPLGSRGEIVAVLEDGPVTWQAAYLEVINDTPHAAEILGQLEHLKIL